VTEYREKTAEELAHHHIPDPDRIVFLEITVTDPPEFETELHVTGTWCGDYRVLRVASPAVANAIAALLLRIRDSTGTAPHIYFDWAEGNPVSNLLRYLIFGVGKWPLSPARSFVGPNPFRTGDPLSTSLERHRTAAMLAGVVRPSA